MDKGTEFLMEMLLREFKDGTIYKMQLQIFSQKALSMEAGALHEHVHMMLPLPTSSKH